MTDRDDEYMLEMEHAEQMMTIELAKAMLSKLSVAELRVLMAHYCRGVASDYSDMRKRDLIDEIAPEYAYDKLGA